MSEPATQSKGMLWTGRVISGLVVLFMLFDSIMKVLRVPMVVEATVQVGYPASTVFGIGLTLLISTILYLLPQSTVFGAILLTGYLGGAVATNVRAQTPVFNTVMAVAVGALVWLGLYLRDARLRALVPMRTRAH